LYKTGVLRFEGKKTGTRILLTNAQNNTLFSPVMPLPDGPHSVVLDILCAGLPESPLAFL